MITKTKDETGYRRYSVEGETVYVTLSEDISVVIDATIEVLDPEPDTGFDGQLTTDLINVVTEAGGYTIDQDENFTALELALIEHLDRTERWDG